MAAVAVSNDLGNVGRSLQRTTTGNNVGDDVGNDVGNGDDGGNNSGNDAGKGDGGDTGEEGKGGLLAEDMVVVAAVATAAAAAAYCRGCLLFIVKIFLLGIFYKWGELERSHLPLTLLSRLRYAGVLLGGDGNCPQKLWYVHSKSYLAKKHGNQSW